MARSSLVPLLLALSLAVLAILTTAVDAVRGSESSLNVIDACWRQNSDWRSQRGQLATCSVGFAGKMTNNVGQGLVWYTVTNPTDDDPLNPRPGTLRYGVTKITGKVWITFQRDMTINLTRPLLVGSFTAIDGRGVTVHIAGGACLVLQKVTNVIIHGIRIHHCKAHPATSIMGPGGKVVQLGPADGDGIRMVTSSKVWIDHNTLYGCQDGLLDITRGSTDITVSNNWFRSQDKVMLLGHDDGFLRDKNMRVTVAFNHFGPNCYQRMPRIRHGYAHVINNLYNGWGFYAIGGSMNPSVKSQANLFIASKMGNKEVTWRKEAGAGVSLNFKSVADVFENGASFVQSGISGGRAMSPNYSPEQQFPVVDANSVRSLTRSAGALRCPPKSRC